MAGQIETTTSEPIQPQISSPQPYKPSFIDRLMDGVQRLPIPYWLTYLGLFVLHSLANHLVAWVDGWLPAYTFSPLQLLFPIWLWLPLAFMTYLNSLSLETLSSFRPCLDVDEEFIDRLKLEFTTMPARGVIITGVIWSVVFLFFNYVTYESFYVAYGIGAFGMAFAVISGWITFFVGGVIYYHSFRQLRLVSRTMEMAEQFNLFQLDPVYSFSRLTAQTAVAWVILLSLTLLTFRLEIAAAPTLVLLVLQMSLAIAAFVLPLWFVHQRLVAEKRRLLAELQRRTESTLARLHGYVDNNDLDAVGQLNDALSGLQAEREILQRIPTWPWRAGTLTAFLSAVFLPIVLFLVQLILGTLLGA